MSAMPLKAALPTLPSHRLRTPSHHVFALSLPPRCEARPRCEGTGPGSTGLSCELRSARYNLEVTYTVLIDDNFHYQDESERVTHGLFETADEAVAACRSIVDEFLAGAFEPGMAATALYDLYTSFGDDPFIVPADPKAAPMAFSAWQYARERCEVMATRAAG
jgi:hypothetical protein